MLHVLKIWNPLKKPGRLASPLGVFMYTMFKEANFPFVCFAYRSTPSILRFQTFSTAWQRLVPSGVLLTPPQGHQQEPQPPRNHDPPYLHHHHHHYNYQFGHLMPPYLGNHRPDGPMWDGCVYVNEAGSVDLKRSLVAMTEGLSKGKEMRQPTPLPECVRINQALS